MEYGGLLFYYGYDFGYFLYLFFKLVGGFGFVCGLVGFFFGDWFVV